MLEVLLIEFDFNERSYPSVKEASFRLDKMIRVRVSIHVASYEYARALRVRG